MWPGIFLELLDVHFPPGHALHSICNRSTIKVSYRSLPNIGSFIARHNSKLLKNAATAQPKRKAHCNCPKKTRVPGSWTMQPGWCNLPGNGTSVVGVVEAYVGLAKNFKKRYPKHKKSLLVEFAIGSTSLSKYFWK
jgi:hypothetical protein